MHDHYKIKCFKHKSINFCTLDHDSIGISGIIRFRSTCNLAGTLLNPLGIFAEKHRFTSFVSCNSTAVELVDDTELATQYTSIYATFAASFKSKLRWGLGLKEKEAAGVPLLCNFVVSVISALHRNFLSTPALMHWDLSLAPLLTHQHSQIQPL